MELIKIHQIGDYYYQLRTETPYGIELIVLKVWNRHTGELLEETGHMSTQGASQRLIKVVSVEVSEYVNAKIDTNTLNYNSMN